MLDRRPNRCRGGDGRFDGFDRIGRGRALERLEQEALGLGSGGLALCGSCVRKSACDSSVCINARLVKQQ